MDPIQRMLAQEVKTDCQRAPGDPDHIMGESLLTDPAHCTERCLWCSRYLDTSYQDTGRSTARKCCQNTF